MHSMLVRHQLTIVSQVCYHKRTADISLPTDSTTCLARGEEWGPVAQAGAYLPAAPARMPLSSPYMTSTSAEPTVRSAFAPAPLKSAPTPSSAAILPKQSMV